MKIDDLNYKILLPITLCVLLVAAIYPYSDWMPSTFLMTLIMIISILASFFLIFLWKEKPADEREALIIMETSRKALIGVSVVLIIATVVTTIKHESNIWPILGLITIIVIKSLHISK